MREKIPQGKYAFKKFMKKNGGEIKIKTELYNFSTSQSVCAGKRLTSGPLMFF
jgi:hypothetical protein